MKLIEALTPTQRTRRYNKKNRGKVRAYLRKTSKDRVQRARDRRAAEKKHGKAYMKNKDVHHTNGVNGGHWRAVPKDHGPDKRAKKKSKNEEIQCLKEFIQELLSIEEQ